MRNLNGEIFYVVYLFNKYLLNAHYLPGNTLGTWDTSVKILFPLGGYKNKDSNENFNELT